ncbi:MAG: FAD-binding protein [Kofleriaceae bacterium]|nr:FAD-binding protein [Kofleriaceae bacterium]
MARRFVNWAGTVRSRPREWAAPALEAEVAERVAASPGRRIRVVGAGHSWSALAAPDDLALCLDQLAGLVTVDVAAGLATVRAGTRLRDLSAALAARGLALPIVGSVAAQAVAGLIATGTHGSSLVHGNLSSLVRGLRLVDGRGQVVTIGADDPRLDGARCHLGALGVVTEVTLPVVPAFRLAETIEPIPVARLAATLPDLARSSEYVKAWWLPHTREALVYRYQRTDEPTSTRPDPARQRWIDEHVLHRLVFPAMMQLHRVRPLVPPLTRLVARTLRQPRRVGPSTLMLSTPMPARHRETEAALPLAEAGEAVERTVGLLTRERLAVAWPLEIRFVRADTGWLSPAHGGDTCQLGAYSSGADTDRYFAGFWRELAGLHARPHWGKELRHGVDEVRAAWPELPRFLALRDALDPTRRFTGPAQAAVLGP